MLIDVKSRVNKNSLLWRVLEFVVHFHIHINTRMSSSSDQITVVTSDKRRFDVPSSVMRLSNLFTSMMEGAEFEGKSEFEIQEVTGAVFEKVLEWCRHHEGMDFWICV